jgi:hypothetical protein
MSSLTCSFRLIPVAQAITALRTPWFSALLAAVLLTLAPGATGQALAQDVSVSYGRDTIAADSTFSFGETRQGRVVSRNFVVRNVSGDSITLATPVISGPGFTARLSGKTFLRPNKKTRLLVQIDTATLGSRSATITIPVEGAVGSPFSFVVSGDVVGPNPNLRFTGPDGVVDSGDDVFFGTARTGQTVEREFTLRNTGQKNLTISAPSLTGSGFEIVSAPEQTIKPGKNTRMMIRMDSDASGARQAIAAFTTNDPDVPQFTMMLSGSVAATGPAIQVIGLGRFLDNSESIDFGTVTAGSERVERFTVRNTGNANLTLGPVESNNPGFVVAVQPATTLAPGTGAEFFVTFISSVGAATAAITIPSNAAENNPFTLNVSGIGEPAPDVQIIDQLGNILPRREGVYSFPSPTFVNNFVVIPFTIKNVGTLTLNLAGLSVLNVVGDAFLVQTAPVDNSLEPGEETMFEIGHISDITGQTEGRVRLFSNDPNDSPFDFDIRVFVDPEVVPPTRPAADSASFALQSEDKELTRGAPVEFGHADVGERVEREFTITNTGVQTLRLGELQIRGAGFAVGRQPDRFVAPGEDTVFSIVMQGDQPGRLAGVVVFSANVDPRFDPFAFVLSGAVDGAGN